MRLYPELPARRTQTIVRDVATTLAVVLFAVLALRVYDRVDALSAAGRGAQDAGRSVQRGFDSAAGAVGGLPVVGGELSSALSGAGEATGGEAVEAGRAGEQAAHDAARLLGWLTFLLPTGLLLSRVLPPRVTQIQALGSASRALRLGDAAPEHARLLASRAAFALPYAALLRHTPDPLGDLAAGRHDRLVAALAEDAGLRAPRR
ncbi:MAG: hypothetical protein M3417_06845 [Actinomycetota bacterium]|nr:hypothetical protein [Actinomycetota bacterium]